MNTNTLSTISNAINAIPQKNLTPKMKKIFTVITIASMILECVTNILPLIANLTTKKK